MKIHIKDNLYIESDGRQIIIRKYTGRENEEGRPEYENIGYYLDLSPALRHVIRLGVMSVEEELTITEAISKWEEIKASIDKAILTKELNEYLDSKINNKDKEETKKTTPGRIKRR